MVAVIRSQIPGIPKLAVISEAAQRKAPPQLRHPCRIPELTKPISPQLRREMTIGQPHTIRRGLHLHSATHRRLIRDGVGLRPALQRPGHHTLVLRELNPDTA
jgi:hypothetical protein